MENNNPPRPKNHLALAIISAIACCLITGVVSIIYSTQVNSKYEDGDYAGAMAASKNAKLWGLIGVIGAVVIWGIMLLIYGVALFSMLASGDF